MVIIHKSLGLTQLAHMFSVMEVKSQKSKIKVFDFGLWTFDNIYEKT